ncbi:hypothetical protein SNEBB_000721 [Seison nebaliae]|nr:hypothetical protein SNEBB_000721 [Seison nebaliae]
MLRKLIILFSLILSYNTNSLKHLLSLNEILDGIPPSQLAPKYERLARQIPALDARNKQLDDQINQMTAQYSMLLTSSQQADKANQLVVIEHQTKELLKARNEVVAEYNSLNTEFTDDDAFLQSIVAANNAKNTEFKALETQVATVATIVEKVIEQKIDFSNVNFDGIVKENEQLKTKLTQANVYVQNLVAEMDKRKKEIGSVKEMVIDTVEWAGRTQALANMITKSLNETNKLYYDIDAELKRMVAQRSGVIRQQIIDRQKISNQFMNLTKDLLKNKIYLEKTKLKNKDLSLNIDLLHKAIKEIEIRIPDIEKEIRMKEREKALLETQFKTKSSSANTTLKTIEDIEKLLAAIKLELKDVNGQMVQVHANITYYKKLEKVATQAVTKQKDEIDVIHKKLQDSLLQINNTINGFIGPNGNSEEVFSSILRKRVQKYELTKELSRLEERLNISTGPLYTQQLYIMLALTGKENSKVVPTLGGKSYGDYLKAKLARKNKANEFNKIRLAWPKFDICGMFVKTRYNTTLMNRAIIPYGKEEYISCPDGTIAIANAFFRTYLTKAQVTKKAEDLSKFSSKLCHLDVTENLRVLYQGNLVLVKANFKDLKLADSFCKGLTSELILQITYACSKKFIGPEDYVLIEQSGGHLHNFVSYGGKKQYIAMKDDDKVFVNEDGSITIMKGVHEVASYGMKANGSVLYNALKKNTVGHFSCALPDGLNSCWEVTDLAEKIEIYSLGIHAGVKTPSETLLTDNKIFACTLYTPNSSSYTFNQVFVILEGSTPTTFVAWNGAKKKLLKTPSKLVRGIDIV